MMWVPANVSFCYILCLLLSQSIISFSSHVYIKLRGGKVKGKPACTTYVLRVIIFHSCITMCIYCLHTQANES